MAKQPKHLKLRGPATWANENDYAWERGHVEEAHLRDGTEFVLVVHAGRSKYDVTLKRGETGRFIGSWDSEGEEGAVSLDLYTGNGKYFLFGEWIEWGSKFYWWSELSQVEHFDRETQE